MPRSSKPGWIDWLNCQTKEIIIEDLANGVIPMSTTAQEAWDNWYSFMWEVQEERVLEEQFKPAFNRHKKQVSAKMKESLKERKMFAKHRSLHPTKERKANGQHHFYKHPAAKKLTLDVLAQKHRRMTPAALWASKPVYQEFDENFFRGRIYQEVRRQKFQRYLNNDRDQKAEEQRQRFQKALEGKTEEE